MKWKILLLVLIVASCKKSLTNEEQIMDAEKRIVGKWKLVQHYRDNNNGMGEWVPCDPNNLTIVQFTSDGKFLHNENFSIQEAIDRYKFTEPNEILLYSSTTSDSAKYHYQQDQYPELIFNPLCMEFSCMQKYARLE